MMETLENIYEFSVCGISKVEDSGVVTKRLLAQILFFAEHK